MSIPRETGTDHGSAVSPLVSVLMVVRNEEGSIAEAVGSVREQTFENWELLVLDGDSLDATSEVVRAMSAVDDRIRLLRNPGRVIPAGLNVGLRHARGDFIARLDGHSRWCPTYLADALTALHARPDAAGVGGRRYGIARTRTGEAVALALSSPLGVGRSIYHYGTVAQDTDHATCGVYLAGAARSVHGWDEELLVNEDVDFDHRLRLAGFALLYDPTMRTAWNVRESIPGFFRQYRRYGRGKAAMVRKNGPAAVRPRHLTAPALVTGLIASTLLAACGRRAVSVLLPSVYAATLVTGAAQVTAKADAADRGLVLPLVLAFAAMHLGWGLGFLEGSLLGLLPDAATRKD